MLAKADLAEAERPPSAVSLDSTNAKSFWVKEKDSSEEESEEMDFPEDELHEQEISITQKAILSIDETIQTVEKELTYRPVTIFKVNITLRILFWICILGVVLMSMLAQRFFGVGTGLYI